MSIELPIELILGADNGAVKPDTLNEAYPKVNRNFIRAKEFVDDTRTDVDNHSQRLTQIEAGSQDGEVLAARGGYATLKDRFDAIQPSTKIPFTLTATQGQTVFTLPGGTTYEPGQSRLEVFTAGVRQHPGVNFTETSTTQFTLSEGLKTGTQVDVMVQKGAFPITSGHGKQHTKFGSDPIALKDILGADDFGVNLKWFDKYVLNGDWIPAINQAINTVYTMSPNGGTVKIPTGLFLISPSTDNYIKCKSNVRIIGSGDTSILKVKNDAGDYGVIFGSNGHIENITIRDIKIDQNATGNTTCDIKTGNATLSQNAIGLFDVVNLTIERVTVDPATGINTININGQNCKDVRVKDCYINFVRGHAITQPDYDNSAMYFSCQGHIVTGNIIRTEISQHGYGGIETHDGISVVSNNLVENYVTAINIVNQTKDSIIRMTSDIAVIGNTLNSVNFGIRLWANTGSSLRNVVVSGNVISVKQVDFNLTSCGGITAVADAVSGNVEGTLEDVVISGNMITFQDEGAGRIGLNDAVIAGIALHQVGPVQHAQIINNILKNAPVKGIAVGCWSSKSNETRFVKVAHNTIINAGQNLLANNGYRSGIFLGNVLRDIDVVDNLITDNFATCRGYQSIWAMPGTGERVKVKRNTITTKQGGLRPNIDTTKVDTDIWTPSVKYINAYPPSSGQFEVDDIVFLQGAVTDGQTTFGYKVTVKGTYGNLSGLTGTTVVGQNTLAVTGDLSQLKVGDIILVAGTNTTKRVQSISGNTVTIDGSWAVAVSSANITFWNPTLKPLGAVGKGSAIADTNGASLAALEAEVNKLKAALRNYGVIS